MKKRVGVLTEDTSLYNKIRLLLRAVADTDRLTEDYDDEIYDVVFTDTDRYEARGDVVTMSRSGGAMLTLPFLHSNVLTIVEDTEPKSGDSLSLLSDGRHAVLLGERIKLTEVEYKLLDAIMAAKGGYVSRESLLKSVWGDGFDAGVVNVYVHYLRNKLERDGRKIILSSRKEGYRIDEKYRRDI